jgi:sulfur relay (sulfurtransferase) DsrF/TusC family protein
MAKNWYKLIGITKTPVVSRRRHFKIEDIGVVIIHGRPRAFSKLTKGEKHAPMTFRAWYGNVEFIVPKHKLDDALTLDSIGRYTNEGMGQITWKDAKILLKKPLHNPRKITIRKMLPKLSETQEKLLIAFLLHDFVHTERHNSKIYNEVVINDEYVYQLVKNHHNYEIGDRELPLLSTLQYYDRLSSSISRKFRWTATSRYRILEIEKIDFHALARNIEKRQYSLYALYSHILKSQELKKVNETLSYGFSSLKNHLLLMVNLYINDLGGL